MDSEAFDMPMVCFDGVLWVFVTNEEFNNDVASHNVQPHRFSCIDFDLQG
jgi:hypothetical protein